MIQRIQTIFLLLASGALGSLFFLPFASTAEAEAKGIFTDTVFDVQDNIGLIVLVAFGVLLGLVSIFSFKNRIRQLRFGYLGIIVSILIPVTAFLYFTSQVSEMNQTQQTVDELGIYAPFVALVLFIAANHYIKKDNKLVP